MLKISKYLKHQTTGVPQGSALVPLLWNTLYDGVLRLSLPSGIKTVEYALVIVANEETGLVHIANASLSKIEMWMCDHKHDSLLEKTEAIIKRDPMSKKGDVVFELKEV